jgi:VanZ family protein
VVSTRLIIALLWSLWLFICTCTASVEKLLYHFDVKFNFTRHPHWEQLVIVDDWHNRVIIVQKIGHFSGFFILSLILSIGAPTKRGLYFCIGFAVFTEIAQLYFNRDGGILDMFIDAAGILCAYGIAKGLSTK